MLAVSNPEFTAPDPPDREIRMLRYFDKARQKEMLLRVVVSETTDEIIIVTLYKTSQISGDLKGLLP